MRDKIMYLIAGLILIVASFAGPWAIIAIVVIETIYFLFSKRKSKSTQADAQYEEKEQLPIAGAYEKEWVLTYNEKHAYERLKPIADKAGGHLLAKVRLLDLVKPKKGIPKYKTYFYKVQAKHVDFVICDSHLVARCIIELDDSSHNAQDRQKRDKFVDEVLESVGYKVIHTWSIDDETERQIFEILKKP